MACTRVEAPGVYSLVSCTCNSKVPMDDRGKRRTCLLNCIHDNLTYVIQKPNPARWSRESTRMKATDNTRRGRSIEVPGVERGLRILVCDDNHDAATTMSMLLELE